MSRIEGHFGSAARDEVVGRADELREVARFLDTASAGPRVLVLEGAPGIGKTTLWRAGVEVAREREYRVLACRPAEVEAKLGYVALVDLLETVPEETLNTLDGPQRRALEIALLRAAPEGSRADPRAVALALLNVLRSLTRSGTVIVAIDDLQWLDSASLRALTFAVRRLDREPIGILASLRTVDEAPVFDRALGDRVERLAVAPLGREDIDRLLRERSEVSPSRHTTSRIHRRSGGNPFFALEIARTLQGQDETFVDDHLSVPPTLRGLVGRRVAALPQATRHALLAASALAAPTIATIAAATGRRDGRVPALADAEAAGVVEVDLGVVRFTHPLLASMVYSEAPHAERRRLHRRLADVVAESEESARHLALAAESPDARVADALDAAAASARIRGAPDDAVTLAELALRLTPLEATDHRQRRHVAAVGYHLFAGDIRRARELAEEAAASLPPGDLHARTLLQLSALTPNTSDGKRLLLQALREARDAALLGTIESSLVASYMTEFRAADASAHAVAAVAHAARSDDPGLRASTLMDVAWSRFYLTGGMSPELIREALELERFCDPTPVRRLPRMRYALMLHLTDQLDAARSTYEALAERARAHGDEPSLAQIFALLSEVECLAGKFEVALDRASEAHDIAVRCDSERSRSGALLRRAMAHAHMGDVEAARAAGTESEELMRQRGSLHSLGASAMVLTFLELSLGDPRAAIEQALPFAPSLVACDVVAPGPTFGFIPDLIEGFVAVGELDQAASYLQALERRATASGNVWARATAGRSRALVEAARGRFDEALAAVDAAVQLHELVARPLERGRTLLVRGVIQRRAKQRRAARTSLTQSVAIFDDLGARLWAECARVELSRIGGRASVDELTPTEAQVAARAAAGETNREIADALFMSVKTVEANLSRVYRKLDVSSRRQLGPKLQRQT